MEGCACEELQVSKVILSASTGIPRLALSHSNLAHTFKAEAVSVREVHDESDADSTADCLALGELNIMFRTDNGGPPNVGLVLTDPRGRRIGFDPLTKAAWDQLPQAQGFIDCDNSHNDDVSCWGTVQVCGPLSGAYKLQVIGQKASAYSLRSFARTKQVLLKDGFHSSHSAAELTNIAIRRGARDVVVLTYSRDPDTEVAVQLHSMIQAQRQATALRQQRSFDEGHSQKTGKLPIPERASGDD